VTVPPPEHVETPLDDLARRVPGQTLMAKCLELQGAVGARSRAARLFGAHALAPETRSWYVGAQGERITARLLDALGPEYVVLHSVPVAASGTDIDHMVIGPSGIVTVNTRYLRDAKVWVAGDSVLVAGRREPFVHAARSEQARVRRLLDGMTLPVTPITPMVAIVDAARITVREAPAGVRVLDARRLVRTIRKLPEALGHDAVWTIAGALASSATWSDAVGAEPLPSRSTAEVITGFARLERAVRVARVARLGWAAGACTALAGGMVALAATLPGMLGG
jgi:hypothetical protein